MKYVTKYKKENYERIWIKKDVAEKLKEWVKNKGLALSEAVDELLNIASIGAQCTGDIGAQFSDEEVRSLIADELIQFVKEKFGLSHVEKIFEWVGGDWPIKDEIISLLVKSGCKLLVEVFGGSGVISMYAPRSVFKVIVYNDKDDLVYNFFKVLREKPQELMRMAILAPFSRKLNRDTMRLITSGEYKKMDDVTKAFLFFYTVRTSFNGILGSGFKVVKDPDNPRAKIYMRKVVSLAEFAKKWLDIILENKDFREIIPLYDSPHTVFYCDPPYLSTQSTERNYYRPGFTNADMRALLNLLSRIKGRFVLKLCEDQLEISYVKDFVSRYKTKLIEHFLSSEKVVDGGKRRIHRTVLIYNF